MKNITGFIVENLDKDAVRELSLWFEHTRKLWEMGEACANSMIRKSKKETMDFEHLKNSSTVDKIVRATFQDYNKRFGLPTMNKATRDELKKEVAQKIWDYYEENK